MTRTVLVLLAAVAVASASSGCGGSASKPKPVSPAASASVAPPASAAASAPPNPDALPPEQSSLLAELDRGPALEPTRVRDITLEVARADNPVLLREATKRVLALASRIGTADFREQHRSEVKSASERHGVVLSDPQLEMKLVDWQNDRIVPVVEGLQNLGGPAVIDWAFKEAEDKTLSFERRKASIRLLQRLVPASDTTSTARLAPLVDEMTKLDASQSTAHDSANDVQDVIASLTKEFGKCNDKAMKKNPKLDVNGSLELKVGSDGVVTDSHAKDVAPADLAACVEKAGKAAHFAPPKSQRAFTVRIPLVFHVTPGSAQ